MDFLLSSQSFLKNILDINLLLVIGFANIFFHYIGWLFILLTVCIAVQKLFIFFPSSAFFYY